jgi:hypothetical protein
MARGFVGVGFGLAFALAPIGAKGDGGPVDKLGGLMVPAPSAGPLAESTPPDVQLAQAMTIFLDFEGPTIVYGEIDDSRTNTSYMQQAAVDYAPYGDATARAALVQAVRTDWAAYAVTITETRPAAGDYVMTVVSPTNPYAGIAAGIAPLDCMDTWTRNNIVYAFHGANDGYSINEQARTVGQEVAHSIGLEHTTDQNDIMSYAYGPADFWFVEGCSPILLTEMSPEVYCVDQHLQFCGASQQNSHAELLNLIGAGTPDTQAPVLSIVSPMDGSTFDEGAAFDIQVEATDEVGVSEVELFVDGVAMASDATAPFSWPVADIPAGQYEMYAEARDAAGNASMSNVIIIDVAPAPGSEDPDGDSSGGEDPTDGDEDADPTDADSGVDDGDSEDSDALPPGYGFDRGDPTGCAFTTDRSTRGVLPWLALAMVVVRRRKRSH